MGPGDAKKMNPGTSDLSYEFSGRHWVKIKDTTWTEAAYWPTVGIKNYSISSRITYLVAVEKQLDPGKSHHSLWHIHSQNKALMEKHGLWVSNPG